jgi:hypothetical protein
MYVHTHAVHRSVCINYHCTDYMCTITRNWYRLKLHRTLHMYKQPTLLLKHTWHGYYFFWNPSSVVSTEVAYLTKCLRSAGFERTTFESRGLCGGQRATYLVRKLVIFYSLRLISWSIVATAILLSLATTCNINIFQWPKHVIKLNEQFCRIYIFLWGTFVRIILKDMDFKWLKCINVKLNLNRVLKLQSKNYFWVICLPTFLLAKLQQNST